MRLNHKNHATTFYQIKAKDKIICQQRFMTADMAWFNICEIHKAIFHTVKGSISLQQGAVKAIDVFSYFGKLT